MLQCSSFFCRAPREKSSRPAAARRPAWPMVFPLRYQSRTSAGRSVDGGLSNPVPVSVCRALGADAIIAVNLNGDLLGRRFVSEPIADTALPPQMPSEFLVGVIKQLPPVLREQATQIVQRLLPQWPTAPGYFDADSGGSRSGLRRAEQADWAGLFGFRSARDRGRSGWTFALERGGFRRVVPSPCRGASAGSMPCAFSPRRVFC
jgi:hypothetical protein